MSDRQKSKSKSATAKEVDISKGLSYLLRHGAKNEGVRVDEGGWANVADVVGLDIFYFFLSFWGVVGYVERSLLCLTCVSVLCSLEALGLNRLVYQMVLSGSYKKEKTPQTTACFLFVYVRSIVPHINNREHLHQCHENYKITVFISWFLIDRRIQLAWRRIASLKVDLPRLQSIVATNDKKRYQIEPDPARTSTNPASDAAHWRIRATQGHSIATVSSEQIFTPILLTDADCPSFVVHGTDVKRWKDIQQSGGLKPMGRNHIHFATWLPAKMPPLNRDFQSLSKPKKEPGDKVISGMRNTSTVMVWADVKKSLAAGVKWWRSENWVILTEGVGEPKVLGFEFIKWVEVRGTGKILYGSRVESDEVRDMETKMDRLGVGLGDGEEVSQDKVDGEKAPQERVPQEKPVNGNDKPESAAALKDRWDD